MLCRAAGLGRESAKAVQLHGLPASLGEKYVNECDLFGCHTVLARTKHQHFVQNYGQSLSLEPHVSKAQVGVKEKIKSANAKLAALASVLAAENETAVEAFNTNLALEGAMHRIEKQTHLDRVKIRSEHDLLDREDTLLHEERLHEEAARVGERRESQELARVKKTARVERTELAAARRRLQISKEDQAKVLAEADEYRKALSEATQKLAAYKKNIETPQIQLQDHAQKQMMEEDSTQNSAHLSDKEIIDRLTEEVHRLTVELQQRESVIQLQQNVIKVQAHEVHQLESTAEVDADAAASTMSNVMKSAEAAMAGETVKHETEEEHENAEIEQNHPGIDPSSIPSAFSQPAPPESKVLPEPEDWRKFGEDEVANNPDNAVPVVGSHGVVAERTFAAGVKDAYGTKSAEEQAAEEQAVKEADAALQSFDKEEADEDAKAQEYFLSSSSASPQEKAHAEAKQNEAAFAKMLDEMPSPDTSVSIDDLMKNAQDDRLRTEIQIRDQHFADAVSK